MSKTQIEINRKVNLTKYLKFYVGDKNLKEQEKNKLLNLNSKIEKFIEYLFYNNYDSFNVLYDYCKTCKENSNEKFKICNYAEFIDFTNYYNLSSEDDYYLNQLSDELEKRFKNDSITL